MTEIRLETDIQCPAEKIFDVITNFRGQDRWLTKSAAFAVPPMSPRTR